MATRARKKATNKKAGRALLRQVEQEETGRTLPDPLNVIGGVDGLAEEAIKHLLEWLGETAYQFCNEGDMEDLRPVLKAINALGCIRNEAALVLHGGDQ